METFDRAAADVKPSSGRRARRPQVIGETSMGFVREISAGGSTSARRRRVVKRDRAPAVERAKPRGVSPR